MNKVASPLVICEILVCNENCRRNLAHVTPNEFSASYCIQTRLLKGIIHYYNDLFPPVGEV